MEILSCTDPHVVPNVDDFLSTGEQKEEHLL